MFSLFPTLCSNAIKFTHEGKVGIKIYVVPEPSSGNGEGSADQSTNSENRQKEQEFKSTSQTSCHTNGFHGQQHGEGPYHNCTLNDEPRTPSRSGCSMVEGQEEHLHPVETTVWIRCDVYDTGIGIPGIIRILIFLLESIHREFEHKIFCFLSLYISNINCLCYV